MLPPDAYHVARKYPYLFFPLPFDLLAEPTEASALTSLEVPFGVPLTPLRDFFCIRKSQHNYYSSAVLGRIEERENEPSSRRHHHHHR